MLSGKQLRAYLAYQVHGKKDPAIWKKPPMIARSPIPKKRKGGTARKGPERSEAYKAWIRTLPSVLSGRMPCEACHTGTDGGMRMKASDYSCVPLTHAEHLAYHAPSGKAKLEARLGRAFAALCEELNAEWQTTRPSSPD